MNPIASRGSRTARLGARPRSELITPGFVLFGSALSGGVHLGLAPEHMAESEPLGVGFLASGGLLVLLGVATFVRPRSPRAPLALAFLLAGLIAAYALSRTAGLPLLHPEPEALDAIGLTTKGVELVALVLALRLYVTNRSWLSPLPKQRSNKWTPISPARRVA
jgi:hypothetical protein